MECFWRVLCFFYLFFVVFFGLVDARETCFGPCIIARAYAAIYSHRSPIHFTYVIR